MSLIKINIKESNDKKSNIINLSHEVNKALSRLVFTGGKSARVLISDNIDNMISEINKAFQKIDPSTSTSVLKIHHGSKDIGNIVFDINKELNKITSII